jgi:hypothetical protein
VSLGGASPLSPTISIQNAKFKMHNERSFHSEFSILNFLGDLKPQQTGTGLLIRYGEVATTSGSTTLSDLHV